MKVPFGSLATIVVSAGVIAAALMAQGNKQADPAPAPAQKAIKSVSAEERLDALARAQVWRAPEVPVGKVRFTAAASQPESISCRFKFTELGGTAQKFDCTLDNGDQIRVKYGRTPEIPSEVAASRLLHALGFGADEVMLVERLRCYGCPEEPFVTMKAVALTDTDALYRKFVNYDHYKDFDWAAVERKHQGRAIGTDAVKGWAFFELDAVDAATGGAPRAHVDALRLLAVFLAHWDNKSDNQRLVCMSEKDWPEGGTCRAPLAMLQDIGARDRRAPPLVDVVAGHQHEPVVESRAVRDHPRGHFMLLNRATTAVADDGKLDRAILIRQDQGVPREVANLRRFDHRRPFATVGRRIAATRNQQTQQQQRDAKRHWHLDLTCRIRTAPTG